MKHVWNRAVALLLHVVLRGLQVIHEADLQPMGVSVPIDGHNHVFPYPVTVRQASLEAVWP
jgi:hypothetical protein